MRFSPPCLDAVLLYYFPDRDIGFHQVVPELRGEPVYLFADPDPETVRGGSIRGNDLLDSGLDRHRCSGDRFEKLGDRAVSPEQDFLDRREPADLRFDSFDILCDMHGKGSSPPGVIRIVIPGIRYIRDETEKPLAGIRW